jgi:hypothetical protein
MQRPEETWPRDRLVSPGRVCRYDGGGGLTPGGCGTDANPGGDSGRVTDPVTSLRRRTQEPGRGQPSAASRPQARRSSQAAPTLVEPTRSTLQGTNPITAMQGPTSGQAPRPLDAKRLTLMSGCIAAPPQLQDLVRRVVVTRVEAGDTHLSAGPQHVGQASSCIPMLQRGLFHRRSRRTVICTEEGP